MTIGTDLFTQHRPALARYAASLTHDVELAEDLTQDTLLRASDRFHTYSPFRPLLPWLKQVMLNLHISKSRLHSPPILSIDQQPYPSFTGDAEAFTSLSDRRVPTRALLVALHSLDERTRECVILFSEGWSSREIGEKMGFRTENGAKARVRRGRLKLKELLSEQESACG